MTSTNDDPQRDHLLARTVKFILPLGVEEEDGLPPDEATYWSDCGQAFQQGLALGVQAPELALRLLAEIVSERAEREHPLFRLVQMGEGGQPPSLSDMDALNWTDLEQAVKDLAEFVQKELGL